MRPPGPWIAEAGEASVREAMEVTTHALWVAVRAGDAIRHDLWCDDGEVAGAALTIGRAGIDAVLATRPACTLPLAWDGLLLAAAVIDVAARVLTLWQDDPPYADLIGALERAWPGWRIERSLDLPAHLAALGLDPTRSWGPDTQRDLDAAFARTLRERETGAALLARVIPAITRPGERVTITDPGSTRGRPSNPPTRWWSRSPAGAPRGAQRGAADRVAAALSSLRACRHASPVGARPGRAPSQDLSIHHISPAPW